MLWAPLVNWPGVGLIRLWQFPPMVLAVLRIEPSVTEIVRLLLKLTRQLVQLTRRLLVVLVRLLDEEGVLAHRRHLTARDGTGGQDIGRHSRSRLRRGAGAPAGHQEGSSAHFFSHALC